MNLKARRLARILATAAVLVGASLGGCDASPQAKKVTDLSGAGDATVEGGPRKYCGPGIGCPVDDPVPDVVGMTVQAAVRTLHGDDYGCVVSAELRNEGTRSHLVAAQKPEPGAEVSGSKWVHLTVSRPFHRPDGRLPVACADERENHPSLLGENLSGGRKLAGRPRTAVAEEPATLRRGQLALSVPRLGIKDVRVPTGSTQGELDREGIIRLASSGVPWYEGSNTFIAGHRLGFLRTQRPYVFYELDEMRPGDEVSVRDSTGRRYVYEVYDQLTVRPVDYWVTYPVDGMTVISLQSCTPIPTFEMRLVVRAALASTSS